MESSSSLNSSPFDCILFDLDDTLYSQAIGIPGFVRKNIEDFLLEKCGISPEKACRLRSEFFQTYGSSLAGLLALGYDVHPDEYHSFVHGRLPYDLIQPDMSLGEALRSIPQTKILFTNSDETHAKRSLERLGLEESIFSGIICFETLNPHLFSNVPTKSSNQGVILKPSISAFEDAIKISGYNPHRTLFVDDSVRNIAAGKAMGLHTALVGKRFRCKEADYILESIENLREEIPEIWGKLEVEKKGTHVIVGGVHHDMLCKIDKDPIMPTSSSAVNA